MRKKIIIAILFLIVIVGGVLGVKAFKKFKTGDGRTPASLLPAIKKTNDQKNNQITADNQVAKKVAKSAIIFSSVKNNHSLDIVINEKKLSASGISIRAVIELEKDPSTAFEDSDFQKKGIQLKANSLLKKSNWLYPINRIIIDKKNKQAVIEIAMINIGLKPSVLNPQEVLATVEFSPKIQPQKITIKFDPSETQALSKNGENVQLALKDGVYEIN